jgi:hypothetical protein
MHHFDAEAGTCSPFRKKKVVQDMWYFLIVVLFIQRLPTCTSLGQGSWQELLYTILLKENFQVS